MPDSLPWSPRRSAVSVQLLTQFGLDHGLDLGTCLHGSGLSLAQLADPSGEIDAGQELQVLRNLAGHLERAPGSGLRAGQRYHLNAYGIWGFAMLSSPTLRSAALLGLRYLGLTFVFTRLSLEEIAGEAHLLIDDSELPGDVRRIARDRDIGGALRIQQDLINGPLPILRAELRGPVPADCGIYREQLGVLPEFGAPQNRIVIDARALDLPLPGANPSVARHCEDQCRTLLARRLERGGVAGKVRDRLLRTPGRLPDMEQVADELHMTSRTLRRRLLDEGSSYRALLDEVRQALAEELLATGAIRLEEIAERLGYGEVSNFTHAFKRWKGVPPGRFRAR